MKNLRTSEIGILEQYGIAIENVKMQPVIAKEMEGLGYCSTKIEEGAQLLVATKNAYNHNQREDNETIGTFAIFKQEREALELLYKQHRKKAKVIFRKNPEILRQIGIDGKMPAAYVKKIGTIQKFYTEIDPGILQKLAVLKITDRDITQGRSQLQNVEKARAAYLREIGESQDATKQKDAAFAKMDDWMRDFYAVANIALEDQPQLREALGRKRKS